MSSILEKHPERVWKIFKFISVIALVLLFFSLFFRMCSIQSTNPYHTSEPGQIIATVPPVMEEGETATINVKIGTLLVPDSMEGERIRIGNYMKVVVKDLSQEDNPSLEITPLGNAIQKIEPDLTANWNFKVTALKAGKIKVLIQPSLSTKEDAVTDNDFTDREFISKEIEVKPRYTFRIKNFISNNWEWLMTAIIIPFWAFLRSKILRVLKKKRESEKQKEDEPEVAKGKS